jgi:formylglycine-generating enzyme required for sulfatase activity
VWEWTRDVSAHRSHPHHTCCGPAHDAAPAIEERVIKGGSHLCAPGYCLRFRPAARQFEPIDTSTGHIGFRCVVRPAEAA